MDKQGLYFNGNLVADNYRDAIKDVYQLNDIPKGFTINQDEPANGYSVIDSNGIQHIYELSPIKFYNALSNLN
jgi:predicted transcriptional regulator